MTEPTEDIVIGGKQDSAPRLRRLLETSLYSLVQDIIIPVRVILATAVVFVVFLASEELVFFMFERLNQELVSRMPYVAWVFDGVRFLSAIGTGVYFVVNGLSNLQTQWRLSKSMEERAGLR
jgi:hypothetical protein